MGPYLRMAKDKMNDLIETLKKDFKHLKARIAVVGYRDYGDEPRFLVKQFSPKLDVVKNYVASIMCKGGRDIPEDINGGLQNVLRLGWQNFTRSIIHIADAPCHGMEYHDANIGDNYENYAPEDKPFDELFTNLKKESINYLFLKIKDDTDIMTNKFR